MRRRLPILTAAAVSLLVPLLAGPRLLAAPETATTEIAGVRRIEANGPGTLIVTIGTPESLSITAEPDDLDRIEVEHDGDELEFGFEGGMIFDRNPEEAIRYEVTVAALDQLEVSGAIEATVTGVRADDFDLEVSGASTVAVADLRASTLDAEISGASDVTVAGAVDRHSAEVSGASHYRAGDLETRTLSLDASGASRVTVRAAESLDIEASGASIVEYSAPEAASVATDESGAAQIRRLPYVPLPAASPAATPEATPGA